MTSHFPLLALLCSAVSLTAQTSNQTPPQLRNVEIKQKLNSQVPLDLVFLNEAGEEVTMRSLLGRKPVILSLVYYQCPRLCNMALNGLLRTLRVLQFTAGNEFDVVTVSFDPRETPALARGKKAAYMEGYGRSGAERGWHFLTGKEMDIRRLTSAVGFGFEYDDKTDQFSHASALMVLTPNGRVSKYFYGIEYSARDLRLGLVEAAARKIGTPVDQILLYCFHYDPSTGKYSMAVMNGIRALALLTLFSVVGLVVLSLRRERPRRTAS